MECAQAVDAFPSPRQDVKTKKYSSRPVYVPVPDARVVVVDSPESLAQAQAALALPGTSTGLAGQYQVVGVDCEVSWIARGFATEACDDFT